MAAARGGTMVVRTGKRSSRRGIRGRSQARRGSGSEDTSDEDYRLGADGEEEDEVSSQDGEDEVGELEVSDEGDEPEDEMSSEGSELEDEDEDFVMNPVRSRKRKPTPKKKVKKSTKPKARKRPPAKKRRSGAVPRVCCDEDGEGMVGEQKPQRRVRKRRRFGDADEEEDGDDVDFSPEDEEEDDDFDDDELEDEEEDVEEEEDDDDDDLEDESNDEEDEVFGKVSVKRKKASRKGSADNKRGGKKRKPSTAVRKRKRSNTKGGRAKRRRKAFVSSDDDEDDEDFVLDDELIAEEEDEEEEDVETAEITRKPNRSGGANARRRRLALGYDSTASYSSDFDDTAPDRDAGTIIGLCTKPRTAWGVRSKQEPKGKEKAAAEEEEDPPEKRICGVCLSEERDAHILGLLNSCAHFFCFTCILEWSKVESRCPVCKQRFSTITKSTGSDLAIQLRPIVVNVPKRDQVYQPSEEEVRGYLDPYANVVCIECLQGGEDTLMLLCDICNSAAHTYCVGLGREVPEGDWYCDACRSAEYAQPNVPSEENENQQVPNGPEQQQPCPHTSNRTGRVDIDMNLPYIPSPERPPPENFTDDSSYLRTGDLPQSAQVLLPTQEDPAARAPRSARQSASTVSERRALRLRIQNMFTNNWSNVTRFRHNPPQGEGRQQPPVLFDDLNASNRDFF